MIFHFSGLHLFGLFFFWRLKFPSKPPSFLLHFFSPNLHWYPSLFAVRPCRDWLLWKTPEEIKCESNSNLDYLSCKDEIPLPPMEVEKVENGSPTHDVYTSSTINASNPGPHFPLNHDYWRKGISLDKNPKVSFLQHFLDQHGMLSTARMFWSGFHHLWRPADFNFLHKKH